MNSRRIPARRSQSYARWALPAVSQGQVLKAEAAPGSRRIEAAQVRAEPVVPESLEQQLVDNIRAGRFASGISARQLEGIVRAAAREGRDEGYAEGFNKGQHDGFSQGRADGVGAGRAIIEDAARRVSGLIEELQRPLAGRDGELQEALLELVVRMARGVVRTELRLQPESIREVVRQALEALPLGAANVRVAVAPQDLDLLRDYGVQEGGWSVYTDPALEPGDCRVESRESVVDYTVSARFAELLSQLFGAHDPGRGSM